MAHRYTALSAFLFAFPALAQFTSADIAPQAGTQFNQHYCQFIYPNGGGVGTTEDYSGLITDSTVTVTYVAASSTPNGSSFPTADVAWQDGNGNYTYYNITDDLMEDVGWDLNGNVVVAPDPETWAVFPLGYGTTWSDSHALSFTTTGITTSRSGTVFGQGDANNTTLLMPYGTVTDVKRVFMYDSYTDSIGGFMTINYAFTYHFYYKLGWHHPVLIVQDLLLTPSIGSPTHKLFSVYIDPVEVGIREAGPLAMEFGFHPQPAVDRTTLELIIEQPTDIVLELVDLTGQLVRTERWGSLPAGTHRRTIDVSALERGGYLVRMRMGDTVITRRLIVG